MLAPRSEWMTRGHVTSAASRPCSCFCHNSDSDGSLQELVRPLPLNPSLINEPSDSSPARPRHAQAIQYRMTVPLDLLCPAARLCPLAHAHHIANPSHRPRKETESVRRGGATTRTCIRALRLFRRAHINESESSQETSGPAPPGPHIPHPSRTSAPPSRTSRVRHAPVCACVAATL